MFDWFEANDRSLSGLGTYWFRWYVKSMNNREILFCLIWHGFPTSLGKATPIAQLHFHSNLLSRFVLESHPSAFDDEWVYEMSLRVVDVYSCEVTIIIIVTGLQMMRCNISILLLLLAIHLKTLHCCWWWWWKSTNLFKINNYYISIFVLLLTGAETCSRNPQRNHSSRLRSWSPAKERAREMKSLKVKLSLLNLCTVVISSLKDVIASKPICNATYLSPRGGHSMPLWSPLLQCSSFFASTFSLLPDPTF